MSGYVIIIHRAHDWRHTKTFPNPVLSPSPVHALKRVANMAEFVDGFDYTSIDCVDIDTGVEQWELVIR